MSKYMSLFNGYNYSNILIQLSTVTEKWIQCANKFILQGVFKHIYIKGTGFGRANRLAVQRPFDFPWSLDYIRNQAFGTTSGSSLCVQPTYAPRNFELTQILPSHGTKSHHGRVEIHFLCQEKFSLGQCRIRTKNLWISRRTR